MESSKINNNLKFYIRNSTRIFEIIFFFCGVSAFIGPFFIKLIFEESFDKTLFHKVFWIGSFYQIICIIVLYYFSEEKFEYKINTNADKKVEFKKFFIVPNIRM